MSETTEILQHGAEVLIQNYARQPVVMVRGQGAELWDSDGKHYIDLFAGFGGAILGHSYPELTRAMENQAKHLWHVGNTYHTKPQIELAQRLIRHGFPSQAFFCHSGLEANEAACKLARLAGQNSFPKRWKIISLNHSFHGRSLAMISATGNPAVKEGFGPVVPGFVQVEAGNIDLVKQAIDAETAGIIIEPIQGEGGMRMHPPNYAHQLRQICDERNLALIFDEVWTGCGRTGRWFGYQHFKSPDGKPVEPDIMTLGKALGGGLPVGAMLAKPNLAKLLVPGKHGCTLGGNPICAAVAKTIFDVMERDHLVERAERLGEKAMERIRDNPKLKGKIREVRGAGLMIGIELLEPPQKFLERALANGVIANLTAQTVIRLAPPMTISEDLFVQGLDLLVRTIAG
jgi:acetylornithine/N-succinyldiaminopimelate aminotransferase